MIARRTSDIRDRIYILIKKNHTHPHAQLIYEALKKEIPSLSLGSVYRNINILVEEGKLWRRDFGDGFERYDAIANVHYHFVCEQCKSISDCILPVQNNITNLAQKKTKHKINSHTINFYGVCVDCKNMIIKEK